MYLFLLARCSIGIPEQARQKLWKGQFFSVSCTFAAGLSTDTSHGASFAACRVHMFLCGACLLSFLGRLSELGEYVRICFMSVSSPFFC